MKKILLVLITLFVLAVGFAQITAVGAEEEACPCGYDEDGECIPANEDGTCS